jgi:hypothetical protein
MRIVAGHIEHFEVMLGVFSERLLDRVARISGKVMYLSLDIRLPLALLPGGHLQHVRRVDLGNVNRVISFPVQSRPGLSQNLSKGMFGSFFRIFGSANPTLGAGAALQPPSSAEASATVIHVNRIP